MMEENEPRPVRGQALKDLVREDLDLQSVEELAERIGLLKGEISRAEAAIQAKSSQRSAADALFTFKG
ncbi:MAG: DUF1192 domain-containing protein [Brevundimonas sp.]|nr:MAG: DUF1192 domain-containing protein [Brevundimonas sp.]